MCITYVCVEEELVSVNPSYIHRRTYALHVSYVCVCSVLHKKQNKDLCSVERRPHPLCRNKTKQSRSVLRKKQNKDLCRKKHVHMCSVEPLSSSRLGGEELVSVNPSYIHTYRRTYALHVSYVCVCSVLRKKQNKDLCSVELGGGVYYALQSKGPCFVFCATPNIHTHTRRVTRTYVCMYVCS